MPPTAEETLTLVDKVKGAARVGGGFLMRSLDDLYFAGRGAARAAGRELGLIEPGSHDATVDTSPGSYEAGLGQKDYLPTDEQGKPQAPRDEQGRPLPLGARDRYTPQPQQGMTPLPSEELPKGPTSAVGVPAPRGPVAIDTNLENTSPLTIPSDRAVKGEGPGSARSSSDALRTRSAADAAHPGTQARQVYETVARLAKTKLGIELPQTVEELAQKKTESLDPAKAAVEITNAPFHLAGKLIEQDAVAHGMEPEFAKEVGEYGSLLLSLLPLPGGKVKPATDIAQRLTRLGFRDLKQAAVRLGEKEGSQALERLINTRYEHQFANVEQLGAQQDAIKALLSKSMVLSAENPSGAVLSAEENAQRTAALKEELRAAGKSPIEVKGQYGAPETSLIVPDLTPEEAKKFAANYGQESVFEPTKGLHYLDGRFEEARFADLQFDDAAKDFYTTVKLGDQEIKFSVPLGAADAPHENAAELQELLRRKMVEREGGVYKGANDLGIWFDEPGSGSTSLLAHGATPKDVADSLQQTRIAHNLQNGGSLGQDVLRLLQDERGAVMPQTERKLPTPSGRVAPPDVQNALIKAQLGVDFQQQQGGQEPWYGTPGVGVRPVMAARYGEQNADLAIALNAVLSPQTPVAYQVNLAEDILRRRLLGQSSQDIAAKYSLPKDVVKALREAEPTLKPGPMTSGDTRARVLQLLEMADRGEKPTVKSVVSEFALKMRNYEDAMYGLDAYVGDTHMGDVFYPDQPASIFKPARYMATEQWMRETATQRGQTVQQLQADIWIGQKVSKGDTSGTRPLADYIWDAANHGKIPREMLEATERARQQIGMSDRATKQLLATLVLGKVASAMGIGTVAKGVTGAAIGAAAGGEDSDTRLRNTLIGLGLGALATPGFLAMIGRNSEKVKGELSQVAGRVVRVRPATEVERTTMLGKLGDTIVRGDHAVQVNWATMREPGALDAAISAITELRPIEKTVVTDPEVATLARELGMSPEQFLSRNPKQTLNAAEVGAAKDLLVAGRNRMLELADTVRANPADAGAAAEFDHHFAVMAKMTERFMDMASEAGRAFRMLRELPLDVAQDFGSFRDTAELTPALRDKLIRRYLEMQSPEFAKFDEPLSDFMKRLVQQSETEQMNLFGEAPAIQQNLRELPMGERADITGMGDNAPAANQSIAFDRAQARGVEAPPSNLRDQLKQPAQGMPPQRELPGMPAGEQPELPRLGELLDPRSRRAISESISKLAPSNRTEFFRKLYKAGVITPVIVAQAYLESLLSGLGQIANVSGNTIQFGLRVGAETIVNPPRGYYLMKGGAMAFPEAMRTWWHVMRNGMPEVGSMAGKPKLPSEFTKMSADLKNFAENLSNADPEGWATHFLAMTLQGASTAATAASLPSRTTYASDVFAHVLNKRGYIYADAEEAARKAARMGALKTKADVAAFIAERVENPLTETLMKAEAFANENTFNDELTGRLRSLQDAVSHPYMRFLMPFVRFGINATRTTLDYTPIAGMLLKKNREVLMRGNPDEMKLLLGKQGMATMMTASLLALTEAGMIRGKGPTDPGQRAEWEKGGPEFSAKLPGTSKWVNLRYFGLPGLYAGAIATAAHISEEIHPDDFLEFATVLGVSMGEAVLNQTFFHDTKEFLDALMLKDVNEAGRMDRFGQNIVGAVVPQGAANLAQAMDGSTREVYSVLDKILSRVPGWDGVPYTNRTDLWPKVGLDGKDIPARGLVYTEDRSDPQSRELVRLKMNLLPPGASMEGPRPKTVGQRDPLKDGVPLTAEQIYRRRALTGNALKLDGDVVAEVIPDVDFGHKALGFWDAYGALIQSRVYKTLPSDYAKENLIRKLHEKYSAMADTVTAYGIVGPMKGLLSTDRPELGKGDPDLVQQLLDKKFERADAQVPGISQQARPQVEQLLKSLR